MRTTAKKATYVLQRFAGGANSDANWHTIFQGTRAECTRERDWHRQFESGCSGYRERILPRSVLEKRLDEMLRLEREQRRAAKIARLKSNLFVPQPGLRPRDAVRRVKDQLAERSGIKDRHAMSQPIREKIHHLAVSVRSGKIRFVDAARSLAKIAHDELYEQKRAMIRAKVAQQLAVAAVQIKIDKKRSRKRVEQNLLRREPRAGGVRVSAQHAQAAQLHKFLSTR